MPVVRGGLIGDHIGASRLSPALELLGAQHGIEIAFTPIDTAERPDFDFNACVTEKRASGWTGLTITHPWKPAAAAYAGSAMAPEVAALGAANTLIFEPELSGHNTDFTGFLSAWEAVMGGAPGNVALAGAGGVARAIGPALAKLGAERIFVWDPENTRARVLAEQLGPVAEAIDMRNAPDAIRAADGLANATPLGMGYRGGTAFDPDLIGPQSWAFDAVYTPTDTAFLIAAGAAGLKILSGFDLFCHMALGTFRLYSGVAPDPSSALPLLAKLRPRSEEA